MTTTDRADILAILQSHHDMLGVDRARIKALIKEMGSVYATDPIKSPSVAKTVKAVEDVTNIRLTAMQIEDRERYMVEARQVMAYVLRRHCGLTLKDIGKVLGRDHSTVMYSLSVVSNNQRVFRDRLEQVEAILNAKA
jgi:chromosomal replication initiation ATPase DnaA